jgi:hypothetical protein
LIYRFAAGTLLVRGAPMANSSGGAGPGGVRADAGFGAAEGVDRADDLAVSGHDTPSAYYRAAPANFYPKFWHT